jgi:hypothetical protein
LLRGPVFAYGMLALLQLRVVWGTWRYRDLSSGDTSGYFPAAFRWFTTGKVSVPWSPLYRMFYGSLMWLTRDPYAVTTLHRLVIVFAASLLVLAVFRRLLPPGLAWLAAAWWTVLPTNFDTLYEVHLFAVLPPLVAWLLLLSSQKRWARGAGLAVLAASAVLVRNEMAVAAVLLGSACVAWEVRSSLRPGSAPAGGWTDLSLGYGVPLALAASACAGVCCLSEDTYQEQRKIMELKHTVNMGQVFTYGYKQRHPECTDDPWSGYPELMTRHFGESHPTLTTMIRRNPRAVGAHVWWNWRLAPSGMQVLLFHRTYGKMNPDYVPVNDGSRAAAVLGVLVLAVWAAGLVCLVRDWRELWQTWIRPRAWGWVGMFAVAVVAVPVISTQRPRPSYLFGLSVLLMALTASSVWVLTRRWRATRWLAHGMPLVMAALVVLMPPYYRHAKSPAARANQRPLHDLTERLLPYEGCNPRKDTLAVMGDHYPFETSAYVWKGRCTGVGYGALENEWPAGKPLEQLLAERNVAVLYLNDRMLRHLESARAADAQAFLTAPPPGWRRGGGSDAPGDRWRLFVSPEP